MSIHDRRKKGYTPRGEFEYAEDYAAEEFAQLAWRDRLMWLDEFVARHELGTWLNDIRGTIGFLKGDPHFSQLSGWAALTDGSILEAIQTGWHLYATVFAYAADMYRSIALIARSYGLQHVDFTGVTDPRTSWPALSLAGKLTTPAALALSIGAAFLSLSGLTTSVTS